MGCVRTHFIFVAVVKTWKALAERNRLQLLKQQQRSSLFSSLVVPLFYILEFMSKMVEVSKKKSILQSSLSL